MKRIALGLVAGGLVALPFAAPSQAGGSCHAEITDSETTQVVTDHACFNPTVARVRPGQTVEWRNDSEVQHSVTATDNLIEHHELAPGGVVRVAFPETGVFAYFCKYHPNMKGVIAVSTQFNTLAPQAAPTPAASIAPVSVAEVGDGISLGGGALAGAGLGVMAAGTGLGVLLGRRPLTARAG